MRALILLPAALTLLWGIDAAVGLAPAAAASFDCQKAASPLEKAICGNHDLSRSDEVLAKAYATALGGLSDAARKVMQANERAWHDFAPLSCSDDAKPVVTSFSDDQVSCLNDAFRARLRDLEQSRMRDGYRFYTRDAFRVIADPQAEDYGPKVASKTFSSPRIDDTDDLAAAFNAQMEKEDVALGMVDRSGAVIDDDETTDNDTAVDVTAITQDVISMTVNSSWYGHGAAHPNYSITYLHFLTGQQRFLTAADVFDKPGWQDALGKLVLAELDRTIEGGIWDEARADVPKAAADPANWSFSDKGLIVQFQPYEVTAYAAGAPTVTIAWDQLEPYMAEGLHDALVYWYPAD